jgi:hypothetical protein
MVDGNRGTAVDVQSAHCVDGHLFERRYERCLTTIVAGSTPQVKTELFYRRRFRVLPSHFLS